ncbi:nephrin-like [Eriocheir sinensis]|uniref:nephrin-like n=1 Tax=Eriocheir sinensis TaxID=95602 RepID=UPI0021C76213|nr:nephrin-like [Eriocheir sinensis]
MVVVPASRVAGVAGAAGRLPCLVSHKHHHDTPVLVLWYRDGARFPFYTLDLREGGDRQEFVDPVVKGRVRSEVTGSHLTLDPLKGEDTGRYKCRVDFEVSPTLFAYVNLTVYVVPSRLMVVGSDNEAVAAGLLGPLTEGEALTLYCVALGGWPAPEVTWWRGSTLLANHSLTTGYDRAALASFPAPPPPSASEGQVRTELSIPALTRDYVQANLSCRAANNNITAPLTTSMALLVYLKPRSVDIRVPNTPLVAGQETRLECVAVGAYPAATLTWTKTLRGVPTTLHAHSRHVGEKTWSYLPVVPKAGDHQATLTCTARNPNISHPGITTTTTLTVVYAPRVALRLGANLGAQPITEGRDVYFECDVDCNPPAREVVWTKDNERVTSQRKEGILVSDRNLVLQTVRRSSAGDYTCTATNTQGTTTSNTLHLDIMYLPVCEDGPQTVAVAEGENTRLSCRVDARPHDDLSFTWFFNNTLDTVEVDHHRFSVHPGLSVLDYTPRSARDYGTLSCWATNTVGTQAEPCRFTVVEAGPPERVANCVLVNLTVGTLEVGCTPGNDGGMPQRFVARVYAAPTQALLATLEESSPRFHVSGLTPGQDYLITVTAMNAKGESEPEEIDAVRLKVAEKRMVEVTPAPVSPLVGVFLGLVGGFVFLLLAGVFLSRGRSHRCRCWEHHHHHQTADDSARTSPPPSTITTTTTTTPTTHARTVSLQSQERRPAPDVLKTINAQLLESDICPEVISARVPPPPYTRTQTAVVRESPATTTAGRPPSPILLPHHESFV